MGTVVVAAGAVVVDGFVSVVVRADTGSVAVASAFACCVEVGSQMSAPASDSSLGAVVVLLGGMELLEGRSGTAGAFFDDPNGFRGKERRGMMRFLAGTTIGSPSIGGIWDCCCCC